MTPELITNIDNNYHLFKTSNYLYRTLCSQALNDKYTCSRCTFSGGSSHLCQIDSGHEDYPSIINYLETTKPEFFI